jgi:anti-sigma B factor antagonist/stage II sporulation protein AA (anti-sigma F factor antagonist)
MTVPESLEPFGCETVVEGDRARVVPVGDLDLVTVPLAEEQLDAAREARRHVVPDLRQVTFLDSTGLRLILTSHARAHQGGFRFSLIQGDAEAQRVFKLVGVLDELTFERS